MTIIVYNKDKSVAIREKIATHNDVRSVLRRAYYELGLIKPDYEVLREGASHGQDA